MNSQRHVDFGKRLVLLAMVVSLLGGLSVSSTMGQGTDKPVDEIRDHSDSVIVIHSANNFIEHANQLMEDIGQRGLGNFVEQFFSSFDEYGVDRDRPIAIYGTHNGQWMIQFPLGEIGKLEKITGKKRAELLEPFANEDIDLVEDLFGPARLGVVVSKDQLILSRNEEQDLLPARDSKWLKERLNQRFVDLFNESGILAFATVPEEDRNDFRMGNSINAETLSEEELESLKNIERVLATIEQAVAGLTYEDQCLELHGLVALGDQAPAEKVIEFDVVSKPFQPTLGLSKRDLVTSISFQLEAFQSPAYPRVLARLFKDEDWVFPPAMEWFRGHSVELASQLLADAWYDVSSARIAMHHNRAPGVGKLCLIGVLEPRNPDQFLDEVRRLVSLVDRGEQANISSLQQDEIAALIQELGAKKFSMRERAQTRLVLAGNAAMEQLVEAKNSTNAEIRRRAALVLQQISQVTSEDLNKLRVENAAFWSNLRPSFSMSKEVIDIRGSTGPQLMIFPDPSKNEADVRDATAMMVRLFGHAWDRVPMIRVGDRFVFMFGSNDQLLEEVVANLQNERDPIADSEVMQRQDTESGQIHVHFSLANIYNVYLTDEQEKQLIVTGNNLSTFTISLDPETWGAKLHIPIEEIRAILQSQGGFFVP